MPPRSWPANWEALRAGEGCPACLQGRADEDEWGVRFFAGRVSDAYLMRRPPQPGYTVVMFRGRHVADPTEMDAGELVAWWADLRVAARAITAVYAPCHLNYQVFGNAVPHVHAHVIPRYLDDPAPGRPLPDSIWAAAADLPADQLGEQAAALRDACGQTTT
jgi:diadenosine tetraphosphate (Ap4A) HIT family hydrolase